LEDSTQLIPQNEIRRQRLHELVIALIHQQDELELMDSQGPSLEKSTDLKKNQDPARWLDRNRRILNNYQALVRSAITLDALLDSEQSSSV
tara:strand:+ start:318 stop:590 length:273 start_codon:yes stop_codon:yes gene_type:complete